MKKITLYLIVFLFSFLVSFFDTSSSANFVPIVTGETVPRVYTDFFPLGYGRPNASVRIFSSTGVDLGAPSNHYCYGSSNDCRQDAYYGYLINKSIYSSSYIDGQSYYVFFSINNGGGTDLLDNNVEFSVWCPVSWAGPCSTFAELQASSSIFYTQFTYYSSGVIPYTPTPPPITGDNGTGTTSGYQLTQKQCDAFIYNLSSLSQLVDDCMNQSYNDTTGFALFGDAVLGDWLSVVQYSGTDLSPKCDKAVKYSMFLYGVYEYKNFAIIANEINKQLLSNNFNSYTIDSTIRCANNDIYTGDINMALFVDSFTGLNNDSLFSGSMFDTSQTFSCFSDFSILSRKSYTQATSCVMTRIIPDVRRMSQSVAPTPFACRQDVSLSFGNYALWFTLTFFLIKCFKILLSSNNK